MAHVGEWSGGCVCISKTTTTLGDSLEGLNTEKSCHGRGYSLLQEKDAD